MFCLRCGNHVSGHRGFCPQCGATLQPMTPSQRIDLLDILRVAEQELAPGTRLGQRYRILQTLGSGRLGVVYLADDTTTGAPVAVKVLNSLVAQDGAMRREVQRLSEAVRTLQHPHILRLLGVEEADDRPFLVMEFAGGPSLAAVLAQVPNGRLALADARNYLQVIAEAMEYAHNRKVCHLDLRPRSILFTAEGAVKVNGFGQGRIARDLMARLSSAEPSATLMGLAPEQVLGHGVDARTDVYALGLLLYEMLAGHPPFYTGDLRQAILHEAPDRIPGVPDAVHQVLQKALAKDRAQRWKSAGEMRQALAGISPEAAVDEPEPPPAEDATRRVAAAAEDVNPDSTSAARRAADVPESTLLEEYRQWQEETQRLQETPAETDPVIQEVKRVDSENTRRRFVDEAYMSEQERKERAAILSLEAEQFAQKVKRREDLSLAEKNSSIKLWSASITLLVGTLLAWFVYKLAQEEFPAAPATPAAADAYTRGAPAPTADPPPPEPAPAVQEAMLTRIEDRAADDVQEIRISPDTARVAYKVRLGNQWFVTVGTHKGPTFDAIDQITFSSGRNKLAYRAAQDGQFMAVQDQKKGAPYEAVDHLSFSPSGDLLAYIARKAGRVFVVKNEKKERGYDWVGHLVISPDSRRLAYAAKRGDQSFVVMGQEKGEEFARINDLVFSPDSQRLAYVAQQDGKEMIVVGGEHGPAFAKVTKPVFSPDSQSLAYIAREAGQEFVVVGDQRGVAYDRISALRFAADGKTVTYVAHQGGRVFVVTGDQPGPAFDSVSHLITSPNHQVTAYVARQEGKEFLVLSGQKGPAFDQVTGLVFSADGRQIAYIAKEFGKEFIVVGNQRGPYFGEVWQPVFTPDARKVVYGARIGRSVLRVEMDTGTS